MKKLSVLSIVLFLVACTTIPKSYENDLVLKYNANGRPQESIAWNVVDDASGGFGLDVFHFFSTPYFDQGEYYRKAYSGFCEVAGKVAKERGKLIGDIRRDEINMDISINRLDGSTVIYSNGRVFYK